jgi:multidrug efflux pump subunit AcrA (membrane-fusion protein)
LKILVSYLNQESRENHPSLKLKLCLLSRFKLVAIILDDWQLVIEDEEEYQNYYQLLKAVAEVPHQSCLAIASSAQPFDANLLANDRIRCLQLEGLGEIEPEQEILTKGGKNLVSSLDNNRDRRQSLLNFQASEGQDASQNCSLTPTNPHLNQSALVPSSSDSLPIVQENDFLPPIGFWSRLGGLFVVGAVGIAVALSAFTPYKTTVKAQAKVRPAGEVKIVEAETEGTVVEIKAKGNQIVKKGDIIATIDNSRLKTQESQLTSSIEKTISQLQQIQAQLLAQDTQILAEANRVRGSVESAAAELRLSSRTYQDKRVTSLAEVEEAQANLRLSDRELQQAQTELRSTEAQLKASQSELEASRSKQSKYHSVAETGAISQDLLDEASLATAKQQQDLESKIAAVLKQKQAIQRQQEAVRAAKAKLQNVRTTLNPSDAEIAIAREKIDREQASGQATLAALKREREALIQQQIEIQKQQSRDRQELQQIEKDLRQTSITATADGVVFQLNLRNSGQTVSRGKEIAQIAPSGTSLTIAALVPTDEIGKVKVGQKAQMRVSACPYPDYGILQGSVKQIAPDAITPQNNNANHSDRSQSDVNPDKGKAFYSVEIKPESIVLGRNNHKCSIQLGMEARADIISQEETLLKFILRKARLIADL